MFPMDRVVVTPDKLEMAILVWLRTCPSHVWRGFEEYETLKKQKRHSGRDAPDPQKHLAEYLAEKFALANWDVTHPELKNHG